MADNVCAYCGYPVLTGNERPEHPLPEAINARLTTKLVCDECNTWAGKHVDQPWLSDPFVGHTRFIHQIQDRRGRVLEYDPFLAGVTEEGVQIRMDAEGRPIPLNSPVRYDPETGRYEIRAKDLEDGKRLLDRLVRKAAAEGKTATSGEPEVQSYQPSVAVNVQIYPQSWERMAAKVLLGFLAESLPAEWRSSTKAETLRAVMRGPDKPANQVRLTEPAAMVHIAAAPASAAFTQSIRGNTVAGVSLLGVFMLGFALPAGENGPPLLWISDPLHPAWSVSGPWESALPQRLAHLSDAEDQEQ